jgi:hypothetical protein
MSGDKRRKKIEELRALKASEFVLRDKLDFAQGDLEEWGDVVGEVDTEKPNLPRLRRVALQAAYKAGWFVTAPKLADEDFVLLPPPLVSAVGDQVLRLYNEVTNPDPSFT